MYNIMVKLNSTRGLIQILMTFKILHYSIKKQQWNIIVFVNYLNSFDYFIKFLGTIHNIEHVFFNPFIYYA